ncbi:MAG: protein-glutamate O-methyltransferase CheR [Candidatus Margulisiibacteriota bacterium]|jgi:chemotaxis protein methyltransferase CheR
MAENDFSLLLEKIKIHTNLDFTNYKESSLKRRIFARLNYLGLKDYLDYVNYLNINYKEYSYLIDKLTINVSEFFRNPEVFKIIQDQILPTIIENKQKQYRRIIRIWSAGVSTGEEIYSLAILIQEILKANTLDLKFLLYGTDIDQNVLNKAKQGVYQKKNCNHVEKNIIRNYFEIEDNYYKIKGEIKKNIRFFQHNLVSTIFLRNIDLILCRNVLIYFNESLQGQIISRFYKALNTQGFLVLGKVESLRGLANHRFLVVNNKDRVYQKN